MADERVGIIIEAVNQATAVLNKVQKDLAGLDSAANQSNKGFQKLGDSMDAFGSSIAKAGAVLTASVTLPLTLLGKTMIQQVSNIEQYRVAFDTMLGSAEEGGKLLKQVGEFARQTPFELPQVVEGATRLLAFNVEAENLIPTLNALGNIAAGVGVDKLPQLILAFGQVKAATRLTGAELRQFTEAGVPLLELLAKQSGKTAAQVKADMENGIAPSFEEVRQVLFGLSEEGGKFANLMQKQSKTLGGVISNLKDQFIRLALAVLGVTEEGEILAGGPFDNIKKLAEQALVVFNKLVEMFNKLSPQIRTAIVVIAALAAALGPILVVVGSLIAVIGSAISSIAAFGTAIGGVALGPIVAAILGTVAALGLLVVGLIKGKQAFDNFLDGFSPEEIKRKTDFKEALEDPILGSVINATEGALTELDKLRAGIQNVFTQGADGATVDMFDGIGSSLQSVVDNTKSALAELQQSRLEDLNSLLSANQISRDDYDRLKQTINDTYDSAIATQDSFVSEYKANIDELKNVDTDTALGNIEGIFARQRAAALDSLTGTQEDFERVMEAINASSFDLHNERLAQVMEAGEAERDEMIGLAQDTYEKILNVQSAGLDSKNEEERKAAEEAIALAEYQKTETIKAAVDQQLARVRAAVSEAESRGGVYDASNKQILTGSAAFWFKAKQLFIAGAKGVGVVVTSFLRNMGNVFSSAYQGILKASSKLWGNIKSGWEALKSGDLGGINEAIQGVSLGAVAVDFASGFMDEFSKNDKQIQADLDSDLQAIVDSYNNAFGNLDAEKEYAKAIANAEGLAEELQAQETAADKAGAAGAGAAGGTGDAATAAKKKIAELGKELEDLGVFAVREGGEIVDTFDDAAEGVDKVKDRIKDLAESQQDFAEYATEIGDSIRVALVEGFEPTEKAITNYDGLNEKLDEVADTVKDLNDDHKKFIDEAQKGLDEYGEAIDEVNKKFDDLRDSAGQGAANDAVESLVSARERLKDATDELADAQQRVNDLVGSDDVQGLQEARDKVTELQNEIKALKQQETAFNQLTSSAATYETQLASLNAQLATLNEDPEGNATKIAQLEQERLVILGKQNLATEQQAQLEDALATAKAKENLSEIDFIAYELGKELDAIEQKRAAELKALEEVRKVREAIIAGNIAELDTTGFSQEAVDLAQKAITEQEAYRTNLEAQLAILEEYKTQEKAIYQSTYDELYAQQLQFEALTVGSYDRIIAKLNQLKQAAEAAAAAQSKVKGGFSAGGFTGFAKGGFTGAGGKDQVAGLVHKGEWVAPKWMVNKFLPMFSQLEQMRVGRLKGFAEGGFTSQPNRVEYNQPITINGGNGSPSDLRAAARYMTWLLRSA